MNSNLELIKVKIKSLLAGGVFITTDNTKFIIGEISVSRTNRDLYLGKISGYDMEEYLYIDQDGLEDLYNFIGDEYLNQGISTTMLNYLKS